MRDYPFLREVRSPVTPRQLRPLSPECRTVQFCEPLKEADHEKLAEFLGNYPGIQLRIYGHYFEKCDLGLLRHYLRVRHLAIEVFGLDGLDGLEHVSPELESLVLGQTKGKAHSLSFLQRFPRLRALYVEGHTKDIDVVGSLAQLENLTLRSITLPDLSILLPLKRLHSLGIKLGGTRNLDLLSKIGRLRYLELWMIRGLTDLGPIASVRTLQFLFLQALRNVKELPSLARLQLLRRIHLETMKGLTDLRPAAKAPALEELVVLDMRHLEPENFRPFTRHRTLRKAKVYLGSDRKNKAIADLLRLPTVDEEFTFEVGSC
jgi:internalin A